MPKKWTLEEIEKNHSLLQRLYVVENKSIREIGEILNVSEKTIFKRLKILGIKTTPHLKKAYCNQRTDVFIPRKYSNELAEFFGIMLGDGSLSSTQAMVTLGNKEKDYVLRVKNKMEYIFKTKANVSIRAKGYHDVYIGSVKISQWLQSEGLVFNKVKSQVNVPKWIFKKKSYQESFLRGFFDTDGSVYKLKHGIQMSFTNKSYPLLESLQKMLITLKYSVSQISSSKIYLTKKEDINRFFSQIQPENKKHTDRYQVIKK